MLSIKRPTSTTVLYTVSTRLPANRVTTKLRRLLVGILRLATAALLLVTLFSQLQDLNTTRYLSKHNIFRNSVSDAITAALPWTYTIPGILLVLYACARKTYTDESLLVIRGLGVQTSTSSPTYLSTASSRFIPTGAIQDIFLHEAFRGFEVKFYLSIVVEGEEDVVVVFPNVFPKRHVLEQVWRGARACLYEPKA